MRRFLPEVGPESDRNPRGALTYVTTRFSYVARALRAGFQKTRRRGWSGFRAITAAGSPPVQGVEYSPPRQMAYQSQTSRPVSQTSRSLTVVLDVSSCSPWDATNFADLLQVLHVLLASSWVSGHTSQLRRPRPPAPRPPDPRRPAAPAPTRVPSLRW